MSGVGVIAKYSRNTTTIVVSEGWRRKTTKKELFIQNGGFSGVSVQKGLQKAVFASQCFQQITALTLEASGDIYRKAVSYLTLWGIAQLWRDVLQNGASYRCACVKLSTKGGHRTILGECEPPSKWDRAI